MTGQCPGIMRDVPGLYSLHHRAWLGIVPAAKPCHSEERSDEESFFKALRVTVERSFAVAQDDREVLRMTHSVIQRREAPEEPLRHSEA